MGKMTRGQRNIRWIERTLTIPKGVDYGKPVRLRPWQKKVLREIYDNPAGTRTAIISFARKNGKTALAAMLAILHLGGPEARPNTAVNSTAQSERQARIVYKFACDMVAMNEGLAPYFKVTKEYLEYVPLGTEFRALTKEPKSQTGLAPALAIHDELGEVRGPESRLFDAIETAMATEEDPLSIIISSQAAKNNDLLSILIDDAKKGTDPHVVLAMFEADEDVNPFTIKALKQANPAFGDFQNKKELKFQADRAKRLPNFEANYRNRHLNQRVELNSPFVSRSVWAENDGAVVQALEGLDVFGGLDLSRSRDLTSLTLIAKHEGKWHIKPTFWLPEDGVEEATERDREPYVLWRKQGFLHTTPGKTIDYVFVAEHLKWLCDTLTIRKIGFDEWNFEALKRELCRVGFSDDEVATYFVPVRQGFKTMSPALKLLETDLLEGRFAHANHPVLSMCAANATVLSDPAGNRKLDKSRSTGRIDGMVTLAMARYVAQQEPEPIKVTGELLII